MRELQCQTPHAEFIKVDLRNLVNAVMNHRVKQKVNGTQVITSITEISAGFLSSIQANIGSVSKIKPRQILINNYLKPTPYISRY